MAEDNLLNDDGTPIVKDADLGEKKDADGTPIIIKTQLSDEEKTKLDDQAAKDAEAAKAKAASDKAKDVSGEYGEFTVVEGMELDKVGVEALIPIAKKFNLSQEQTQELVTLAAERTQAMTNDMQESWEKTQDEWKGASQIDKEFGGAKFDENVGHAKEFLKAFGTPELMNALNLTGVGNHPEFIRIFVKAGKAMSEDNSTVGGKSDGTPKDPAKVLFPDMA